MDGAPADISPMTLHDIYLKPWKKFFRAALWEIINGEFNPSGRLAQSWPRSVGYVGSHADSKFGPEGLWQGDYVGMGWRDGEMNGPLFELGAGLSYGGIDTFTFAQKEVLTASIRDVSFDVHVDVKSTAAPGGTVVQLYFSQAVAQAVRPKLMLLAFAKIERSTTSNVTLTVPVEDLGYFHPLTKTTNVDVGSYTLHLGTSSAKLHAQTTLTLRH
jgi:beta-glucosidase